MRAGHPHLGAGHRELLRLGEESVAGARIAGTGIANVAGDPAMSLDRVEKIASALLYEGYLLYPYRPSAVKNRQRFNFGVLYPREYCEHQQGSDRLADADRMPGRRQLAQRDRRPGPFSAIDRPRRLAGGPRARSPRCRPARCESLAAHPVRRAFVFAAAPAAGGSPPQAPPLEGELQVAASWLRDELCRDYRAHLQSRRAAECGRAEPRRRVAAVTGFGAQHSAA